MAPLLDHDRRKSAARAYRQLFSNNGDDFGPNPGTPDLAQLVALPVEMDVLDGASKHSPPTCMRLSDVRQKFDLLDNVLEASGFNKDLEGLKLWKYEADKLGRKF
jgi:hypothetical protein